ncbi:MAG: Lrp/AsnC family transcriptional regulator [Candidatus Hodarchaeales archaeon]|jgi:Lrp/AsnC family leucine-responsive transcriptional regulator
MESNKPLVLTSKDHAIITLLKKDASIRHEDIAKNLTDRGMILSRQTVSKRIKIMEDNKIIKKAYLTDDKKLGKEITAFILIDLSCVSDAQLAIHQQFIDRMNELELLEVHYVAGQEDVLVKMRTRTIDTLRVNLVKITQIEGVSRTRTMISLTFVDRAFPETKQEFLDALEVIATTEE